MASVPKWKAAARAEARGLPTNNLIHALIAASIEYGEKPTKRAGQLIDVYSGQLKARLIAAGLIVAPPEASK